MRKSEESALENVVIDSDERLVARVIATLLLAHVFAPGIIGFVTRGQHPPATPQLLFLTVPLSLLHFLPDLAAGGILLRAGKPSLQHTRNELAVLRQIMGLSLGELARFLVLAVSTYIYRNSGANIPGPAGFIAAMLGPVLWCALTFCDARWLSAHRKANA